MADEISFFNTQGLMSGLDGATTAIIYIILYVLAGLLIWGCFYLLSFKHKVRVRQETASGVIVIDTKAREFKTREGLTKWRLLKYIKESCNAPSNDYLELTGKGKLSAEVDRSRDGTLTWRRRSKDLAKPDSLSSEERSMTIDEMRRSETYNKKSGWDKVKDVAPLMLVVIIVVMLFAFWGEITKGTNQVAADNRALGAELKEASQLLADSNSRLTDVLIQIYPDIKVNGSLVNRDVVGGVFVPPPN